MTYRKGFFMIDLMYGLGFISLLIVISLFQYAQVTKLLQQVNREKAALAIALGEIEELRSRGPITLSDKKTVALFTVLRTMTLDLTEPHSMINHIMVVVMHDMHEIVSLETGVFYEKAF
jgi:hypothetical protein